MVECVKYTQYISEMVWSPNTCGEKKNKVDEEDRRLWELFKQPEMFKGDLWWFFSQKFPISDIIFVDTLPKP